jgi:predicted acetyltransferase
VKPPKAQHLRRDANPFHMAAYRTSVTLAQERYFDRFYGRKQLSLAQLATHPDYFGHGAAAMSLEWGLALGEKQKWPITLFAGPKAYSLYSRFGFKTIVVVTTKVVDEDMELKYPGLAWEPTGYLGQAEEENVVQRLRELVVVYDVNRDTQSN